MIEQIYIGLFIGLICLWIGFRLGSGNDTAMKRKRFRSYIELLRREIKSKQPSDFVFDYHKVVRGVPKFEIEKLEIRPHIREKNVPRFDDACTAYKDVRFGGFGDNDKMQRQRQNLYPF